LSGVISFIDPAFEPLQRELNAVVEAAWQAYSAGRKAPHVRKGGPGFADPDYKISNDWLGAQAAIKLPRRNMKTRECLRVYS
jgi:hypothetical protein